MAETRKARSADPGPRRQAREAALQVLYALDAAKDHEAATVLAALRDYWLHLEGPAPGRPYGDAIVNGVVAQWDALDEVIRASSVNWRLERMARVDRNVLRVAAWEILHGGEVPVEVAIDEAVELAKRFGSEESSAFVNGILDRLATQQGRLTRAKG
ncbi:MAG: transcription antitermination factor NusB [Polyangiales bacterium]